MSRSPRNPERLLDRVEWTVIRRLDGLLQGDYRTLFRGFGLDLAELREYQPGDDVRYIDWNVTARLATPYVRQYNEDREITAWLLLDASPSMGFGSAETSKHAMLEAFTAAIARLLTRHGNRVGAVIYTDHIERVVPAGGGRRQVLQLLHALESCRGSTAPMQTDLKELLVFALRLIVRRSLVFLVSDFLSREGWEHPLGHLSARHETLAVRLFDPLERELPDLGIVSIRDAESGERLCVDTHERRFRRRFIELTRQREEELTGVFRKTGVDVLELSTRDDLVDSLLRFVERRKQRSLTPSSAYGRR